MNTDTYIVLSDQGGEKPGKRTLTLAKRGLAHCLNGSPTGYRPAWFSGPGYLMIRSDILPIARKFTEITA